MSDNYRAPTLADVARAAKVSVPTVSRVLTGNKYVSPELAERVREAVKLLAYRPNTAARSMRSGHRTLVTVLTGATTNYGYAHTLHGLQIAARRAGMSVCIVVIESASDDDVARAVELALAQPTAGVVVLEFDHAGIRGTQVLPAGLPTVVARGGLRRSGTIPAALIDERTAGQRITDHLLKLGHRTVHHIAGPTAGKRSGRTEGWRVALTAAGAPIPPIMNAQWDAASGYRWGEQIATMREVTAVLCGNDEIAIGLMRALEDRGLRVPHDISVAGFDDQPIVSMWRPALTTVHQDFEDLGARAFELLMKRIDGRNDHAASIAVPRLVIRESTAAPRPDAPVAQRR